MSQNVYLVVTSAFVLAGDIVTPDMLVEVTDSEARNLLSRGKARLATADDGVPVEGQEDDAESEPDEADDKPKRGKK